jgi:hypothetical protein
MILGRASSKLVEPCPEFRQLVLAGNRRSDLLDTGIERLCERLALDDRALGNAPQLSAKLLGRRCRSEPMLELIDAGPECADRFTPLYRCRQLLDPGSDLVERCRIGLALYRCRKVVHTGTKLVDRREIRSPLHRRGELVQAPSDLSERHRVRCARHRYRKLAQLETKLVDRHPIRLPRGKGIEPLLRPRAELAELCRETFECTAVRTAAFFERLEPFRQVACLGNRSGPGHLLDPAGELLDPRGDILSRETRSHFVDPALKACKVIDPAGEPCDPGLRNLRLPRDCIEPIGQVGDVGDLVETRRQR